MCPGPEETQERPACGPQQGAGSHLPLNCGISPVGLFGSPLWQASLVKATVTPQLPSKNPICWLPASWGSNRRWVTELGRTAASLAERGLALDSGEEVTSGGRAVGHVPGCMRCAGTSGRVAGSPRLSVPVGSGQDRGVRTAQRVAGTWQASGGYCWTSLWVSTTMTGNGTITATGRRPENIFLLDMEPDSEDAQSTGLRCAETHDKGERNIRTP